MVLTDFWTHNYRSVKNIWLKLERIAVIVGPNGSGKSNLYRAIYLVASTATGQLARSIADEGGMESILWSGKYGKKESHQVRLSVRLDKLMYDLVCGIVPPRDYYSLFSKDLEIKQEAIYLLDKGKKSSILKRGRAEVTARDASGKVSDYTMRVAYNESILTGLREPYKYPQISKLRQEFLQWRFYHHFRTDKDSPLRKPQRAIFTPVMSHDGSDCISALGTIMENGNYEEFLQHFDEAFPGSSLAIEETNAGLRLKMSSPEFGRPLDASELSDGTLKYICLLTALFSLDAPSLLVMNEPESSIHSSLYEPLAKLFVRASQDSQLWITTHSQDLSDYILEYSGYAPLELEKVEGQTQLVGVGLGGYREEDDEEEDDDS